MVYSNPTDLSKTDSELQTKTLDTIIPLLQSNKSILRRKSVNILNSLIPLLDERHFDQLVTHLKTELNQLSNDIVPSPPAQTKHSEQTRAILQALTTFAKLSGDKFGTHVPGVISNLFSLIETGADEVKEAALQCIEYIVLKCSDNVQPFMQEVFSVILKFLKYDPNYADDDDEDEQMETDEDDDDDFLDDDEDGVYSDDEDLSWKVRRASAKVFVSLFATQSQLLYKFHQELAPLLIRRLSEREENVRIEVIQAYITLLHHTREIVRNIHIDQNQMTPLESDTIISSYITKRRKVDTPPVFETFENQDSIGYNCQKSIVESLPRLISAIVKQLNGKSLETHQAIFQLLGELTLVIPGHLIEYLDAIAPYVKRSLDSQGTKLVGLSFNTNQMSTTLQSTVLTFVKDLIKTHDVTAFGTHLQWLTDAVVAGLDDSCRSKTSEQGYRTCEQYFKSFRVDEIPAVSGLGEHFTRVYNKLIEIIQHCIQTSDTVGRNKALTCLGTQLNHSVDLLGSELHTLLPLLKNLLTEQSSPIFPLRTLFLLLQCPFVEWNSISQDHPLVGISISLFPELISFLQKSPQLKLTALMSINEIVTKLDRFIDVELFKSLLTTLQGLVNDSDLQVLPIAVDILTQSIKEELNPQIRPHNMDVVTSSAYFTSYSELLKSPVIQGATLTKVVNYFRNLVLSADNLGNPQVANALLQVVQEPIRQVSPSGSFKLSKSAYATLSKVTAGLALTSNERVQTILPDLAKIIQSEGYEGQHLHISLLIVGEIGKLYDLSSYEHIYQSCLEHLRSANAPEDIKLASAFALGGTTVSNLGFFLPKFLEVLRTNQQHRNLLLLALKEVTAQFSSVYETLDSNVRTEYGLEFWTLLTSNQDTKISQEQEATRNIVSEALSHVLSTDPSNYLPKLQGLLSSDSFTEKATLIAALRHTLTHLATIEGSSVSAIEPLLVSTLQRLLPHLNSPNLDISKITIITFNASIHHQPKLLSTLLPELIPRLLELSKPRPELVRVVDMGPFKVNIDDGLDVRKSTYECYLTLLNTIPERFDSKPVLLQAIQGLGDVNEIKQLAIAVLLKFGQIMPTTVASHLDYLVDPLTKTLSVKLKDNAIKQDREKHTDMVVGVLRLLKGLEPLLALNLSPKFNVFFTATTQNVEYRDLYLGLSQ